MPPYDGGRHLIRPPLTKARDTVDFGRPQFQVPDIDGEFRRHNPRAHSGAAAHYGAGGAVGGGLTGKPTSPAVSSGIAALAARGPYADGGAVASAAAAGTAGDRPLQLHELLATSCKALGRSSGEATRTVAYLESEWLNNTTALMALSEDGWQQLHLPLALKEELKRHLHLGIAVPRVPSSAKPSSSPPAVQAAQDPAKAATAQAATAKAPPAYEGPGLMRLPKETEDLVLRIKAEHRRRGTGGVMKSLARRFDIMDNDRNKLVSYEELFIALSEITLHFDQRQKDLLWQALDTDGSGYATYEEVVALLGSGMSERRRRAVRQVFQHLDMTGDGTIQVDDLRLRYDPTVLAEQGGPFRWKPRPSDEALAGFLEGLRNRVGGIVQGVVFPQDFERYYEGVSTNIDHDEYFEEMLKKAWNMPDGWLHKALRRAPAAPQPQSGPAQGANPPAQGAYPGAPQGASGAASLMRDLRANTGGGSPADPYSPHGLRAHVPGSQRLRASAAAAQAAKYLAHRAGVGWQGPSALAPSWVLQAAADQPLLVSGPAFVVKMREIFPAASKEEIDRLHAAFAEPGSGMVDYQAFLSQLHRDVSPARWEAARAVFEELAGPGARVLDLSRVRSIPPGFRAAFQEQTVVSLEEWMAFHGTIAATLPDSDDVYATQLRWAWSLGRAGASRGGPSEFQRPATGHGRYNGGYAKGVTSKFTLG